MSADPSTPSDANRQSGGYVVKNIMYNTQGGSDSVQVFGGKFAVNRIVTAEQFIIPPSREDLPGNHPCAVANRAVFACNEKLDENMRLAGRVAACNEQRKELMRCFTTHKDWEVQEKRRQAKRPWWQFW
jgi:hypothetical protein